MNDQARKLIEDMGGSGLMAVEYTLVEDLEELIGIQPESIVSRTFHKGDTLKGIIFGFDTGQELSEHTSSQAAIIQILKGEASVSLGDDHHELSEGAWIAMPPQLPHSIVAKTPLIMLLMMFGTD
jgi:quercetin dioxygenase-like cupin family protein